MKTLRTLLALSLLVAAFALPGRAQSGREPTYGARLTAGLARVGEEVGLIINVENADAASIVALPRIDGVRVGPIPGPSEQTTYEISPGRRTVTRTITWRVVMRPVREGDYEIPGIELVVDGRTVVTEPLQLKVVEDLQGAEQGFFETSVSPATVVEGQPVVFDMTFGWDEGISNRVNVANLILPWWGRLPGLLELESPPALTAQEVRINLNTSGDIIVEEIAPITRDGRRFRSFRLRRVFLATRPNQFSLPQPFLEFGQAESRGFGGGRRRRETYFVSGSPMGLVVEPLPEEGQPLDFTGAIGDFEVHADADPRDVDVGESIKLAVTYTGEGNHQFFDPVDVSRDEAFEGFRVFGVATKKKTFARRELVYDLAPLSDAVTEIPSVRLPVFDTREGVYTTVDTEPIPIRVRALEGAVTLEAEGGEDAAARDIRDIVAALPGDTGRSGPGAPGPLALSLSGGGVVLLWLALRTEVRRRRGDPDAPAERRRRRARKELARALESARDSAEELRALHRFLSARTREPEWAWVGRDPEEVLDERPELSEGARELAAALRRLERATYSAGGSNGDGRPERRELLALADRLVRGGL